MTPACTQTHLSCKIGWEGCYGKLLLNHPVVLGFSQSSVGMCKMIHDVSLFPTFSSLE